MVLKKTGASYFLWGVSVALFAVLVTLFWYLSAFLPDESKTLLAVVLALLTIIAVCLIAFAAGRLSDLLQKTVTPNRQVLAIAGDVAAGIMLLATFLARIMFLSKHAEEITDPWGLYEQAMIVGEEGAVQPETLLQGFCIGFLKPFLRIAGNRIIVAAVVMAILQTVMIICFYYAVRFLSGRPAAFAAASFAGFLPAPFARLYEINDQSLLFAVFALTLFLVALYLHFDAADAYGSLWQIIWYVALGVMVGFTVCLDLAAIILWIPLLFAFAIPDVEKGAEALRLLIVFAASLAVFVIFLATRDGGMTEAISGYFGNYLGTTNTIRVFHIQTDVYGVQLLAVTLMAVIIVTFWRDRLRDQTSFWLAFFLVSMLFVPLFGGTKLNDQELFCFAYGAVTGTGIACLIPCTARVRARYAADAEYGAVPDGMVLPVGEGDEDEISRMRMPEALPAGMALGIDRGEGGEYMGSGMDQNAAGSGGVQLNKDAQKALARAQKEREKKEARARKAQARAEKKAERERLRMLADAEDEAEEQALLGIKPSSANPDGYAPLETPSDAEQAAAAAIAVAAAAAAATAAAAGSDPTAFEPVKEQAPVSEEAYAAPEAQPVPAAPVAPAPAADVQPAPVAPAPGAFAQNGPVMPVQPAPAPTPAPAPKPAPDPTKPVSLAAISPFAGKAPQTSQPSLVRNTAFSADGSDDFDFNVPDGDDFDV